MRIVNLAIGICSVVVLVGCGSIQKPDLPTSLSQVKLAIIDYGGGDKVRMSPHDPRYIGEDKMLVKWLKNAKFVKMEGPRQPQANLNILLLNLSNGKQVDIGLAQNCTFGQNTGRCTLAKGYIDVNSAGSKIEYRYYDEPLSSWLLGAG